MNTDTVHIERRGGMLAATIPTRTGAAAVTAVPWTPGAEAGLRATALAMLRSTSRCQARTVANLGPVSLSRREDHARWRLPHLAVHRRAVALGWHNTSYVATW